MNILPNSKWVNASRAVWCKYLNIALTHLAGADVLVQRHQARQVSLQWNHEAFGQFVQVSAKNGRLNFAWSLRLHSNHNFLEQGFVLLEERSNKVPDE